MSNEGVAVGIVGMGVVYLGAAALAQVVLFAVAAAAVAGVIAVGVIGTAMVAWAGCLRTAYRERDGGWIRDLLLAPTAGIVSATALSYPLAVWMAEADRSNFMEGLRQRADEDPIFFWFTLFAVPALGFLFFVLLFNIPRLLARRDVARLLAYPGFMLLSTYLAALGISYSTGMM